MEALRDRVSKLEEKLADVQPASAAPSPAVGDGPFPACAAPSPAVGDLYNCHLRELSRTAQATMLRRYMAYMASADEPDDSDSPGFSDKAAYVWDLARSGIKGATRAGYKRTRSLAHADGLF